MPVPEEFYDATFVFGAETQSRHMTYQIGCLDISIGGPRTAIEVADSLYDLWTTAGHPGAANNMIDEYFFVGVSVAFGTPTGDLIGQHFDQVDGTVSDSPVPSNCAMIVSKNTALGGRRHRGRLFHPPSITNEGSVDASGFINGAVLGGLQTQWDAVHSGMLAYDLPPYLFHQGAGAPAPTLISSFTVQGQIGTQRRRMRN